MKKYLIPEWTNIVNENRVSLVANHQEGNDQLLINLKKCGSCKNLRPCKDIAYLKSIKIVMKQKVINVILITRGKFKNLNIYFKTLNILFL